MRQKTKDNFIISLFVLLCIIFLVLVRLNGFMLYMEYSLSAIGVILSVIYVICSFLFVFLLGGNKTLLVAKTVFYAMVITDNIMLLQGKTNEQRFLPTILCDFAFLNPIAQIIELVNRNIKININFQLFSLVIAISAFVLYVICWILGYVYNKKLLKEVN